MPMYPILTQPKQQPVSFKEKKEAPPPHVPAWLPAFPDQHTYKSTAVFQGRQEEQQQPRQVGQQLSHVLAAWCMVHGVWGHVTVLLGWARLPAADYRKYLLCGGRWQLGT